MINKDSQFTLFEENHHTKGKRIYLDDIELVEDTLRHKSSKELIDFESGFDWSDMKDRKYIIATFFSGFVFFVAMITFLSLIYLIGV